jgi:hypothetical protein
MLIIASMLYGVFSYVISTSGILFKRVEVNAISWSDGLSTTVQQCQ